MPRRRKALFAALAACFFLAAVEAVFHVFGLFAPERIFTDFRGADGGPMARYELNGLKPEFSRAKPPGTLRIVVAGGSTALGFPYHPRSSIGARLGALLEDTLPGARVEVINLGRMGMDSAEVEEVVRRSLDYGPDLVVVYSGQNEFIAHVQRTPLLKWLDRVDRGEGIGRLRVARMLTRVAAVLTGGLALTTMKSAEDNPESWLELPPPPPLSPELRDQVLTEYRRSLQNIARDCHERGVPLILSTMASNLRDWPPALGSLADGPASSSRNADFYKAALATIHKTEGLLEHGRHDEALNLIQSALREREDYAAYWYELGRAKTAIIETGMKKPDREADRLVLDGDSAAPDRVMGLASDLPGRDPAYQEKLRAEALSDFRRARDEEARVTMSNRAPSAINDIVREVSKSQHALLLDTEKLIEESSYLAPGFDWFDDHCHPTLGGQQVIAEALYDLVRENAAGPGGSGGWLGGAWSGLEWSDPSPWDEDTFRAAHGIDDQFLHGVLLRLGIYLGMEKDLPSHSRETRKRFAAAAEKDPADPLPAVLEAMVAADYGDTADAASLVRPVYASNLVALTKCLGRYFAGVELRQGVLMARLNPGFGNPPLRGLLKSGLLNSADAPARASGPLDQFNFFMDLDAGGADVSAAMQQALRARKGPAGPDKSRGPLVLADAARAKVLEPGPGAKLISVARTAQYAMDNAGAFLTTGPVRINPSAYGALILSAAAAPGNGPPAGTVAWAYVDMAGRPANAYVKGPELEEADGAWRARLGYLPRWVMAREITEVRVMPGRGGTFELSSIKLISGDQ